MERIDIWRIDKILDKKINTSLFYTLGQEMDAKLRLRILDLRSTGPLREVRWTIRDKTRWNR